MDEFNLPVVGGFVAVEADVGVGVGDGVDGGAFDVVPLEEDGGGLHLVIVNDPWVCKVVVVQLTGKTSRYNPH